MWGWNHLDFASLFSAGGSSGSWLATSACFLLVPLSPLFVLFCLYRSCCFFWPLFHFCRSRFSGQPSWSPFGLLLHCPSVMELSFPLGTLVAGQVYAQCLQAAWHWEPFRTWVAWLLPFLPLFKLLGLTMRVVGEQIEFGFLRFYRSEVIGLSLSDLSHLDSAHKDVSISTTFTLSLHPLTYMSVVSIFWLLWTMLQWTQGCRQPSGIVTSFPWVDTGKWNCWIIR